MSDLPVSQDTATLYVLGELSTSERRAFEAQMAASAELRELVRELEEGLTAMARIAPRKNPPPEVWQGIEKAVDRERSRTKQFSFWLALWRNGWAAAAACLVGWLVYAHWAPRSGGTPGPGIEMTSEGQAPGGEAPTGTVPAHETVPGSEAAQLMLETQTHEILVLRGQVTELLNRIASLSQTVTQQQALLNEPSRLKFLTLNTGNGTAPASLSPQMQQALALAIARDLGWSGPIDGHGGAGQTDQTNVDFVDLHPHNDNVTSAPVSPAATPPTTNAVANTIPAFMSGTNLTMAIDPSMAPSGSLFSFFSGTGGDQQSVGSAVLGANPLVVTMPVDDSSAIGTTVSVVPTGTGLDLTNIYLINLPGTYPLPSP